MTGLSIREPATEVGGARLLVSVSNIEDRIALKTILRDVGFADVVFVTEPSEALELIEHQPFDLILLDVMQSRSGVMQLIDACAKRPTHAALPVVVIAPPDALDRAALCIKWGADDFLSAPFNKTFVSKRVCATLERRRFHRESARALVPVTKKLDDTLLRSYGDASSRFVPKEFLDHLDRKTLLEVKLGDHVQREMTVFFSDIRDFTALSEQMTPKQNFDFLNSYLQHVNPIIRDNNGFIDKYIGDAIMALFPATSTDAVRAAVQLQKQVMRYNTGRKLAGYQPLRIGIGLHRGDLILGTIGEEDRMQTTVISDAVNLAARMEGLTKTFGSALLVSNSVVSNLDQDSTFKLRHLGAVKAKGKAKRVDIYECYDNDEPDLIEHKDATADVFTRAVAEFQKGLFLTAGRLFQRVAAGHSDDGPAKYYRDRCSVFAVRGSGAGRWDGADLIETK